MLTSAEIAEIQGWSQADYTSALQVYQAANPAASGLPADAFRASLFEARVLDILSQNLNAQLAGTFLIPPEFSVIATRLSEVLADGSSIADWPTATPPAVTSWWIGDVLDSLKTTTGWPAVVVTASLPYGSDVSQQTIGITHDVNATLFIYYAQPYLPNIRRQVEAARGAEAIANVLRNYLWDTVTGWQNGRVQAVQRNTPQADLSAPPRFVTGMVQFSVFSRVFGPVTGQ